MPNYMDKQKGREFLLELAEILDTAELPFFLINGTALGAYRDNGFTPTERDIDLGFLQEHLTGEVLGDIVSLCVSARMDVYLLSRPFNRVRTLVIKQGDIHADVVGFIRWKDVRFAATPDDAYSVGPRPYCIVHEARLLEPPYSYVELFGRGFNAPSSIETYLSREYGFPDWMSPKDDHVSRARVYDYLRLERIPDDYLAFP